MPLFGGKSFSALAVLVGTIIGAGIFGIPYVVAKSGIFPSIFYFLILGGMTLLLHLFFGEIVLRTKGKHRLIGFAQKYLGRRGRILITLSTFLGLLGVLLAYIILGGNFLKIVLSSRISPSFPTFYLSLIFWLVLSYFVFLKTNIIARAEIFTNTAFFLILLFIFFIAFCKINLQNFVLFDKEHVFLPFGIFLFSFAGWTAIPEIGEILKTEKERKNYQKIIVVGTIAVFLLYLLFSFSVVGVSGTNTSQEALLGLVPYLGQKVVFFGALAAVVTLADSFLAIALYLKNTLIYDFRFPKFLAALFSSGLPLILFLIGFRSFIDIIGFVGIVMGVVDGTVIALIFRRIKETGDRKPEYSLKIPPFFIYLLIATLVLGAVFQVFSLFSQRL